MFDLFVMKIKYLKDKTFQLEQTNVIDKNEKIDRKHVSVIFIY